MQQVVVVVHQHHAAADAHRSHHRPHHRERIRHVFEDEAGVRQVERAPFIGR